MRRLISFSVFLFVCTVAISCDGTTSNANAPVLSGPILMTAEAGESFSYSVCLPALDDPADLCAAGSSRPMDGQPPYHFQLKPGAGFPPLGITLGLNGILSGSATVPGEYNFSVCAVDLAASQGCAEARITVLHNATTSPTAVAMNCSSPCSVSREVSVWSTTPWTASEPGFGSLGTGWVVSPTSGPAGNSIVTIAYAAIVPQPAAGFIRFRTTQIGRYAELDVTLTSP